MGYGYERMRKRGDTQLLIEVLGCFGEVPGLSNDLWYLFFLFSVSEFLVSTFFISVEYKVPNNNLDFKFH